MDNPLTTNDGMTKFLDDTFGVGEWVYNPDQDLWIAVDKNYAGEGKGYLFIQRGGNWQAIAIVGTLH